MADLPAYIRNFNEYTRSNLTVDDALAFEAEAYGFNDRARTIILGSVLESALEEFLRSKTRPSLNSDDRNALFDLSGPLGNFSSKILVGYAFNWYGPNTRHDMDLVRLMRNAFAHSQKNMDFEAPAVAAMCAQLRAPESQGAKIPDGYLMLLPSNEIEAAEDTKNPRTRFIMTTHIVMERLLLNAYPTKIPPDLT